jgi:hypothetical protein
VEDSEVLGMRIVVTQKHREGEPAQEIGHAVDKPGMPEQ